MKQPREVQTLGRQFGKFGKIMSACTRLSTQAVEDISPGTKIAVVTRWAPNDVKVVIRQALGAINGDYNRLAQLVRDFIASGKVYESSGLRGDTSGPMDVGGIYDKGKAKGGGKKGTQTKKNDKCNKCGKTGHWAKECWSTGTYDRQGQGQVEGQVQRQGQVEQGAV